MSFGIEFKNQPPMQGESEIEAALRDLEAFIAGDISGPMQLRGIVQEAITAAEARGYERCLKEIDEKCPEVAHTIVRPRLNAQ